MNIVGRIKLPKSVESSALYIQCNEAVSINYQEENEGIVLRRGGLISSSSYFNSFYERYYAKYTTLHSIYYLLKLEGDFKVFVYREVNQSSDREKIFEGNFENCQLPNPVKLPPIELLQGVSAGRLYIEIVCLSEQGIFQEGWIATDETKAREISLGIVICTFKKEDYVKDTLATLFQDKYLQDKDFKVFLVDNGRTLEKASFNDSRLKLIPNKNAGGSGGFTRGLVEALEEDSYSHFLVMDDDIELESESIYRLFSLHEYAKSDFIVAGGLLNLNKKHVLYEAGATFNDDPTVRGRFGSLTALNYNMDLRSTDSLNQLLIEEDADYGGFWFCSFSKEIIEKIKLPLPLFIKLDDVEFCLRAKKVLGVPIVTFPSIAVWHIPSSAKSLNWETYYYFRNDLITFAIHGSPSYADTVSNLTKEIMASLLASDYDRAQMLIKAFEDYTKGPDFIKHSEPDVLHLSILKLSRTYENQNQVDKLASIQLLDQWSSVAAKGKIDWSSVSKDWKSAAKEMITTTFWRQYLEPKEPAYATRQ
ncbi:MAG: glycosyltransferase family 2 protein [Myxacorys californica WJT36-NPBG1]|nr:glycosyltransferase family 2 protein [Myxacorys californica WJT36-NPBG1]